MVLLIHKTHFNPHSPCGERHVLDYDKAQADKFQSTLPMRGATRPPRALASNISNFNPHSPCGERRWRKKCSRRYNYFNPHSPCGERPSVVLPLPRRGSISIHTPHAGSDGQRANLGRCLGNFNPHSPCGERPALRAVDS